MTRWKFLREWIIVTVVAFVLIGSISLTYSFGVQAHDDRVRAQQDRLSAQQDRLNILSEQTKQGCARDIRIWNTFQNVIAAATNPPSRAGQTLTAEQVAALQAYRAALVKSVGPEPTCDS
jgi:hypothetical protein